MGRPGGAEPIERVKHEAVAILRPLEPGKGSRMQEHDILMRDPFRRVSKYDTSLSGTASYLGLALRPL